MAYDTTSFTGAVAAGTPLIASAAGKQIRIRKIIVSVHKVEAGKILKIGEESGDNFFAVSLAAIGTFEFTPGVSKGEDYVLAANKDLDYTADSTSAAVEVTIVTNHHIDVHS